MKKIISVVMLWGAMVAIWSCAPKEEIQFVEVKNIVVQTAANGEPVLKGDAIFFNPNNIRMKLRKAKIDILVNEKKSATVDQVYDVSIPANGNFTVPVEAQLSLKEVGLLDTIVNLLGGKKYKVQFIGSIHASVRGVRVRVPVNHTEETRLKF